VYASVFIAQWGYYFVTRQLVKTIDASYTDVNYTDTSYTDTSYTTVLMSSKTTMLV